MRALRDSNSVLPQTLRYGAVGLVVLAVDIGVYLLSLMLLPGAWLPANIAGKAAGAATGFFLHRNVTFRGAAEGSRARQGASYVAPRNVTLRWLLVEWLSVDAYLAKFATEIIVIGVAFVLSRTLVFRTA